MPIYAMPTRCGAPPRRCGVIRRVASPFHCQSEQAAQGFSTANQIGASAKPCRAIPLRCISIHCIALPSRRISMLCLCQEMPSHSLAMLRLRSELRCYASALRRCPELCLCCAMYFHCNTWLFLIIVLHICSDAAVCVTPRRGEAHSHCESMRSFALPQLIVAVPSPRPAEQIHS